MNSDIPSSPDVEFLDGNKRENHGLPYGQQQHHKDVKFKHGQVHLLCSVYPARAIL